MTAQIVAGSKLIKKHMPLISLSLKPEITYEGLPSPPQHCSIIPFIIQLLRKLVSGYSYARSQCGTQ